MTHPYDSTCPCAACRHTSLALQERPDCARAPVVSDPIGEIIARCQAEPSLSEMLRARARCRIRCAPEVVADHLAAWEELGIEVHGNTPAARAASDEDLRRAVRQKLSLGSAVLGLLSQIDDLRAQVAVARDLARQYRRDLEVVLSDLRSGGEPTEFYVLRALREPTVDDALAGLQVDAALARAGEAVPRG